MRWGVAQSWGHRFVAGPTPGWVLAFYGLLVLAAVAAWAVARGPAKPRLRQWLAVLWCAAALSMVPGWLFARYGPSGSTPSGDLLAVGHGLAVVLHLEDDHTLLYDCGRMGDPQVGRRIIAPALWSRGINRLDQVYLSHADQDHYNALPDLLDRFKIGAGGDPSGLRDRGQPWCLGAARSGARPRHSRTDHLRTGNLGAWPDALLACCTHRRTGTRKPATTPAAWCLTSSTQAVTSC